MQFRRPRCRSRASQHPGLPHPAHLRGILYDPRACAHCLLGGPEWGVQVPRLPQPHLLSQALLQLPPLVPDCCRCRTLRDCTGSSMTPRPAPAACLGALSETEVSSQGH